MSYSEKIFGKSLRNLVYQDIVHFFATPQEENDVLEFKAFTQQGTIQEKFRGLYKSISAFLNSSGGILIWGAPIGTTVQAKAEKIFQGALTSIDTSIEKDSLVSRISANLIPLANSFNLQLLENGSGDKICIVEIEPSTYAPHQFDTTYYMRLDGQSRPAPHHYIEALFKRISYPNLEGYLKFDTITPEEIPINQLRNDTVYKIGVTVIIFNFSKLQNEENIFFTLKTEIGKVENLALKSLGNSFYNPNGKGISKRDALSVLTYGNPYMFGEAFIIDPHEVSIVGDNVRFMLSFGGKRSPLKTSSYKINIRNFRNQPDTNKLLTEINENQFMYEFVEQEGITKEDQLKTILGR